MAKKKLNPNELASRDDGRPHARQMADMVMEGISVNAHIAQMITMPSFGLTGIQECMDALRDQVDAAKDGDLSGLERIMAAQAYALNLVFHECTRRAVINMGDHLGATDTYMRLALRAQNQARSTVQTLADIKNPRPVAFVHQANISSGHQQVVNEAGQGAGTRAREIENRPNELLEGANVTRLDTGTTRKAVRGDSSLATVEAIDRASNARRQSPS